jgi:hypothetical protein
MLGHAMRFANDLAGRPAGCPSDLTLDRLHAGELPPEQARALREHAEGCEGCRGRMALRTLGFAAFPEAQPGRLLAGVLAGIEEAPARPWWRLTWLRFGALGAAAAAALVLLAVAFWPPAVERPDPAVRTKGSLGLTVFLKRGDQVVEALSGDAFRAGDRLRFALDLPAAGHVFLVAQDAQGHLEPCHPFGPGAASRPVQAGSTGPLEGAVELDGAPGDEWIHLVHCTRPFGPDELSPGNEPGAVRAPEGCRVASFLLRKTH